MSDIKEKHILHNVKIKDWEGATRNASTLHALEAGKILFFPKLAFSLLPNEKKFLSPHSISPKTKNISYDSKTQKLRGIGTMADHEGLRGMMQRFSESSQKLIAQILPAYSKAFQIGRTSFRPVEISGRIAPSIRKDDTRLHVDAFPASPNQGKRILRVFTNINPDGKDRIWHIGEPFETVARHFLPSVRRLWWRGHLLQLLGITRGFATEYDYTMLQIHNNMKSDDAYQKSTPYNKIHFPTGTSWIVQTDHVSHAALSGQHVLEQTFYLPIEAMLKPELSPLRILEKLTGRKLL